MRGHETKPWSPERIVDARLARELVGERFFTPRSVEPIGEGWDNTVFLVDGEWVFRFPRREIAVPLLENEARLLPKLAPRLPLPIPKIELFAESGGERFPWPFAGHRLIEGRTTDDAEPGDDARRAAAPLLGNFLRVLHAQPDHAPNDTLGRTDVVKLRRLLRERLPRVGVEPPAWIDEPIDLRDATCLLHGDLHPGQVLFQEGRLCGVIDWGDAHRGHPAVDLAIGWSLLPPGARPAFRAAYGPIDDATWRFARLRALHLCAALAVYAQDLGDIGLQRKASGGIERASTTEAA
jgi:aminoglycoside phosphotransferase (APT) family kinase protein